MQRSVPFSRKDFSKLFLQGRVFCIHQLEQEGNGSGANLANSEFGFVRSRAVSSPLIGAGLVRPRGAVTSPMIGPVLLRPGAEWFTIVNYIASVGECSSKEYSRESQDRDNRK